MRRSLCAHALLIAVVAGCGDDDGKDSGTESTTGTTSGAGTSGDAVTDGGGEPLDGCRPAPNLIRRLTRAEFANTVRDLLGYEGAAAELPPDPLTDGFDNDAEALGVTLQLAEKHLQTAEKIAAWATTPERLDGLLTCPGVAAADPATQEKCVRDWLAQFGRLALRRPVTAAEVDSYMQAYARGAMRSFTDGVADALTRILLSPSLWYRVELGTPVDGAPDLVRLTSLELASRLGYFIWRSTPDALLLDAAEQNALDTPEQVAAQVDRMLADPRARLAVREFFGQLLELDQLAALNKVDVAPDMGPLMRAETERFIDHVVWDSHGGLAELLTSDRSFVPPALAWLYGLDAADFPPGTDMLSVGPIEVALDPSQRAGLLTQLSTLAIRAFPAGTRPIVRGKFVRERLLCAPVPPPPPGANNVAPAPDPSKTTRQQYEEHAIDPMCSGCHDTFDDFGFAFEHYDHAGRWRLDELGKPIDAGGQIAAPAIGPWQDGVELAHQLADSPDVRRCVVKQVFRFGFGRREATDDTCLIDRLDGVFLESETDLLALVRAIAVDEAFRHRTLGGDN